MKTNFKLIALAASLASLSGVASAQAAGASNVTLYGKVDSYLEYNSGAGDSRFAVQSGGMSGSRWGLKGSEDLGGGLKAIMQLESGFFIDNGQRAQGGRQFGRQAYVGLSGGFGTLTLGRQYTAHFNLANVVDPFETGYASAFSTGVVTTVSRLDNAIVYMTPTYSGFNAQLTYAPGEKTNESSANTFDLGVNYAGGPIEAGISYLRDHDSQVASGAQVEATLLGGTYNFGIAKIYAGYDMLRAKVLATGASTKRNEFLVGTHIAVYANTSLWLGYAQGKVKDVDQSTNKIFSAGVTYDLSKRTNLYTMFSYNKNDKNAPVLGPSGASSTGDYLNSTNSTPGTSPRGLAVGIRHVF